MTTPPTGSLGHLLILAARSLKGRLTEKLAPYGLTSAQWAVLAVAAAMGRAGGDEEVTTASVAGRLRHVDRTTMSGIVRRLLRDGWITVESDPSDRRTRVIRLTEKAGGLLPVFETLRDEVVAEASRGMSEAERGALSDSLRKVIENLNPSPTS